jgi:hypothetical protein
MKPAWPWMLAHLKIIWQFHDHPVHQKVSRFFGPRYIGDNFFLGPNLVSFNQAVVPYEISKVNFRVETFLSVCQKRFNKLKNINTFFMKITLKCKKNNTFFHNFQYFFYLWNINRQSCVITSIIMIYCWKKQSDKKIIRSN